MPKETKRSTKAAPAPVAAPTKRGGKAAKDPNAPKKALSSYMLFTQDYREIVKSENPGLSFGMFLNPPPLSPQKERAY